MLRAFFLVLFLGAAVQFSQAATGCVANSTGVMYLQKTGANYRYNGQTATRAVGCMWIYNVPSTNCTINGGVGAGKLAQDSPQNCPVDDWVYLLILTVAVAAVYRFRQRPTTPKATV